MCKELMLVIEVDGLTHQWEEVVEKDRKKQRDLEKAGFKVLHFHDDDVLNDMNNVIRAIQFTIEEIKKTSP